MNPRRTLLLSAVAAVGLGAGVYAGYRYTRHDAPTGGTAADAPDRNAAASGTAAGDPYARTLPDVAGQPVALARWKNQVLVLNFWATWCAPCVAEMPEFQRVRDDYAPRGVEIVGIGIDNAQAIAAFQARLGIRYPLLVAGADGLSWVRELGNAAGGLPFTVVYGRDGALRHRQLGRFDEQSLRAVILSALA